MGIYPLVDPHPFLEGGGGDVPPSPTGLFQSHFEGGNGDAAQCGDGLLWYPFIFLHTY
jgi:hypothetical protein